MSVRFAPSPTGSFHIGNLRTAWISFELAKILQIPWILRFEDIDQARVKDESQKEQLTDLEYLGIKPSGKIFIQSHSHKRHYSLFQAAILSQKVYPCFCSRKDIQNSLQTIASAPHETPPIYDGHCRTREYENVPRNQTIAWRFKMPDESGKLDFIVARSTDLNLMNYVPSYHWACAIDDYDQGHSLIVRAWDLLDSLIPQMAIFEFLASIESPKLYPKVFHTALVSSDNGHRLEKRTPGVTLKELIRAGYTKEKLLKLFSQSFDSKQYSKDLKLNSGEDKRILLLKDLLR